MKLLKKVNLLPFGILGLSLFTNDVQAATQTKSLVYCIARSPSTLSPALVAEGTVFNAIGHQVYDKLVRFKPGTTEFEPWLAKNWDISKDGKTITLHLRKGVKFHSNKNFKPSRDFNADDVLFFFFVN